MSDTIERVMGRVTWITGGTAFGAGVYALCTVVLLIILLPAPPSIPDLIVANLCFGIGAIILGIVFCVILAPREERAEERRAELVASIRDSYTKILEVRAATAARRADLEELEKEEQK